MKLYRTLIYIQIALFTIVSGETCFSESQTNQWNDYQTIMWVGDSVFQNKNKLPLFFQRMREMGITGVSIYGEREPSFATTNGFNYYVENIINRGLCLKWNSKVSDWDKFIRTWMNTRAETSFIRDYCLDDPQWRNWAISEMQRVVSKNRDKSPLLYDIRDELSITISANPFDYDFNPITLKSFRLWLKETYKTLEKLNAQWETKFSAWDEVMPFTTDRIKNRMASGKALPEGVPDWQAIQRLKFEPAQARKEPTRWNFSPWCDFRTYMDISLSSILDELRKASHKIDPRTPVGIEGTQMPHAFGGYDLWRLSQVLDWVEPYDIGNSREIFGSFMSGKLMLTTVFENETFPASRRLWHLLLSGDKGCIIWWSEDCLDWKSDDLKLTSKANALKPVIEELKSPLAQLFMRAERVYSPVAFLYSQPSIQVDWLLESCIDGNTWVRRYSSYESSHNRMAKARNSWLKIFQDIGMNPIFISTEELTRKDVQDKYSIIVLPTTFAMSDAEINAVLDFLKPTNAHTKLVFCDGCPALFDEHGKLRGKTDFENILPLSTSEQNSFCVSCRNFGVSTKNVDIAKYERLRVNENPDVSLAVWVKELIERNGVNLIDITGISIPVEGRILTHKFRYKDADLYALERNINYHMSEDLKQTGGNEALEKPIVINASLNQIGYIYNLYERTYLGHTNKFSVKIEPWRPTFIAVLKDKVDQEKAVEILLNK